MGLKAEFNANYVATKENDFVLGVQYTAGGYTNSMLYDFNARIMFARTRGHGDGGISITPFSQLDRDTLIDFREKLLELGGHPPELPKEPATQNNPTQKLKL